MKMPDAVIREEISKTGVISFARFMELALYCPETGYYEAKKDNVGRAGDFITSVSTGSLFGELLAFQFCKWFQEFSEGSTAHDATKTRQLRLTIAEAGAHDGKLARDVLSWLRQNRAGLFKRLQYVIVEPSVRRREWQKETLESFGETVRWVKEVSDLRGSESEIDDRHFSIFFSNELLDAFPVHRYGWDAARKEWFEWGVALKGEQFQWSRMEGQRTLAGGAWYREICPPELEAVLPDGYVVEISPSGEQWWRNAAESLGSGKLVTIDYGYQWSEMFAPHRRQGTLRAYAGHRASDDLLARPGSQDLTAHVNFGAIQRAGEQAGLQTEFFGGQPQFLTRILQRAMAENVFETLDAKRVRQFQTLTHPEHLGRAFSVLVQGSAPRKLN